MKTWSALFTLVLLVLLNACWDPVGDAKDKAQKEGDAKSVSALLGKTMKSLGEELAGGLGGEQAALCRGEEPVLPDDDATDGDDADEEDADLEEDPAGDEDEGEADEDEEESEPLARLMAAEFTFNEDGSFEGTVDGRDGGKVTVEGIGSVDADCVFSYSGMAFFYDFTIGSYVFNQTATFTYEGDPDNATIHLTGALHLGGEKDYDLSLDLTIVVEGKTIHVTGEINGIDIDETL